MGSQLTRSQAIHFHFGTRVVTLRRAAVTDNDKRGQPVKRQALAYLLDTTMLPFPPAEKTKWWYDDALGYALCITPLTRPANWKPISSLVELVAWVVSFFLGCHACSSYVFRVNGFTNRWLNNGLKVNAALRDEISFKIYIRLLHTKWLNS